MQKQNRKRLQFVTMSAVAAVVFGTLAAAQPHESEVLGELHIGQVIRFERATNGDLVEVADGKRHIWPKPAEDGRVIQVEFGLMKGPNAIIGGEWMETVDLKPLVYDTKLRLFAGDRTTRTWTPLGSLPDTAFFAMKKDRLAVDPNTVGRMFWAGPSTIWQSVDNGAHWTPIANVGDHIERIALALDGRLVAFSATHAYFGEVGDEPGKWLHDQVQFPKGPVNTAILSGVNEILVTPMGEESGYTLTLPATHQETSSLNWLRESSGGMGRIPMEVSTRTATTQGCRFEVFRYRPSTRDWVSDNYWDFNFDRIKIRIDIRFRAGDPARCVWSAPFSSPHWSIQTASGRRVSGGPAGDVYVDIPQNNRTFSFMRAIAIHVEDRNRYIACNATVGPNDSWAIVVQNHRNGGTACQAIQNTPTLQQANAQGRILLNIPIRGSNPGCPQTAFNAIACVAAKSSQRYCSTASITGAFSAFKQSSALPSVIPGMGECVLPDID